MKLIDALASETLSEYTRQLPSKRAGVDRAEESGPELPGCSARAQAPCSGCRLRGGDGTVDRGSEGEAREKDRLTSKLRD